MGKSNGTNGWVIKGTIGFFIVITGTLTGVFATSMVANQRHTELKQAEHGERLSSLEAFNVGLRDDVQKMDVKLDRILERIPR